MPWTDTDISIARQFSLALKSFDGDFNQKKYKAAQSLGYENYMALPSGVRSFIAHLGAEARKRNKALVESITPVEDMEEEWWNLYESDPDFRHAMTHPDDIE